MAEHMAKRGQAWPGIVGMAEHGQAWAGMAKHGQTLTRHGNQCTTLLPIINPIMSVDRIHGHWPTVAEPHETSHLQQQQPGKWTVAATTAAAREV
jgi:hypothetical protein